MKKTLVVLFVLIFTVLIALPAFAEHVRGYTRSDGTFVQGYERSSRDSTVTDNYDYKGNQNPYTGQQGSNYYRDNPTSAYYGTSSSRHSRSNDDD